MHSNTQLPNPLQIGLSIIYSNISNDLLQLLHTQKYLNIITKQKWAISYKDYLQNHWNYLFPFIKESSCSELSFDRIYHLNIIMDISNTNFIQLKKLSLLFSKIVSIQQFQFMNMPLLEIISLLGNEITNTSALDKCKWDRVNWINLRKNRIQQLEICRMKMKNQVDKRYGADHYMAHNWLMILVKMDFEHFNVFYREKGIQLKSRQVQSLKRKGMRIAFMINDSIFG